MWLKYGQVRSLKQVVQLRWKSMLNRLANTSYKRYDNKYYDKEIERIDYL